MKPAWISLDHQEKIGQIVERSHEAPCLIFKHSHRCEICHIAQYRLEDDWPFEANELTPYFLDVVQHRAVSLQVAETFSVQHESPQILLIVNGECVHDASHLDITINEIHEGLAIRNRPVFQSV